MGYQPCRETIVIYHNGNKSADYKSLSFFEKLKAKSIHSKYDCDVYLVTNHIKTTRYFCGKTITGEILYQSI